MGKKVLYACADGGTVYERKGVYTREEAQKKMEKPFAGGRILIDDGLTTAERLSEDKLDELMIKGSRNK